MSISPTSAGDLHDRWNVLRSKMPVAQRWAYFDHAAVAPLPAPTKMAMNAWLDEATADGDVVWEKWSRLVEQLRHRFAKLINANTDEIALLPNTTSGLSVLAEGFPWQPGDNVVTLANEFPSNVYPWMNLETRGVETRLVPVEGGVVDLDRVSGVCDERTRVVSLSWVGYASGWRIDVRQAASVAHKHNAVFCLDAIQGLGVFPLDVRQAQVDFLAADGHKWLMGPEGAGLCYIRSGLLERLRPIGVGWNSVQHRYDFGHVEYVPRQEAARYEGGSTNMVGYHGLAASVGLLSEFGWDQSRSAVSDRVLLIADLALARLREIGARLVSERDEEHRSGIICFRVPEVDPDVARRECREAGVVLSCRGGGLRISPHAYNNEEDVERLVSAIKQL